MSEKSRIVMKVFWGCLAVFLLSGCSPCPVHEAERILSRADSVRAEGGLYGRIDSDSLQLANAYRTLGLWKYFHPDEYARCCYHYGRLLREKDNPVAAMQCFINATHTHTRDYHILGRVYNNIGDMCHLANDFSISCDMFERSAEMYRRAGDTILYYYCLNDMAFELAEQRKKEETLVLLDFIMGNCKDESVIAKTWETRAELYRITEQYDSALYCADQLIGPGHVEPTVVLIKAQAFDDLHINDSALFYANEVLSLPYATSQDKFNAVYIVLHCDSALSPDEIKALGSQREDIRYYEYEPEKEKLILSVQLLHNECNICVKNRKIKLLVTIVSTIMLVIIFYIICKLKKIYKLRYNTLEYRKKQFFQEQETTLRGIEERKKELVLQQNKTIRQQSEYEQNKQLILEEIKNRCSILHQSEELKEILHWRHYNEVCQYVDRQFYMLAGKLKQYPEINERDIRMCILVLLDLSYSDISELLYVEEGSVGKLKERTAKKLHTSRKNLRQTLLEIVVGDNLSVLDFKLSSLQNS